MIYLVNWCINKGKIDKGAMLSQLDSYNGVSDKIKKGLGNYLHNVLEGHTSVKGSALAISEAGGGYVEEVCEKKAI